MKSGANQKDIVIISKMFADGSTAQEVSETLGIEMSCVESFAPKGNPIAPKPEPVDEPVADYTEEKPAVKTNPLKPKAKAK